MESNALLLPLCFFGLYMILEAADWGLCLAAPIVSRNREENKTIIGLLRPGLDGNELWFFLGLFMLSAAIPTASETPIHSGNIVLCVFVVLGALLRLAASFLQDAFSSPIVVKAFSIFSFLGLGLMGLSGSSFIMDDGSFVTVLGIFCALWMILAAFQLGCLYGAVKVVNPLGERFRAAFLVASVLTVVVYIILAILLKSNVGSSHMYGSFFWMGLVATAILFLVAFFFTRSRHVKVGLAAAYLSSFFAISIYLSAYAVKIPLLYKVEVGALKSAMAAAPGTALLVLAIVWSLGAFVWRQIRKKQEYEWRDHI